MEHLRLSTQIRLQLMILLNALLSSFVIDCSEFNQPVTPIVPFTREANNRDSTLSICFWYSTSFITLRINQDPGNCRPSTATLLIKLRNNNEYMMNNLSGLLADFRVNISIDTNLFSTYDFGWISYTAFNNFGDTLQSGSNHLNEDQTALVSLGDKIVSGVAPFFWQIEFKSECETVRLPKTPGIWYFGHSVRD